MRNSKLELRPAGSVAGPWQVTFDPAWQSPSEVTFAGLDDWSKRAEPDIRHYSGIAVYRRTFDLPAGAAGGGALYLDLGVVHNLAEVRLNGRDLGVLWCPPWRVAITDAVQPAGNALEIRVANFWPNRLIGDAALPPEKRRTRTNVTKFKPDLPLNPSGLLGPVQLLRE